MIPTLAPTGAPTLLPSKQPTQLPTQVSLLRVDLGRFERARGAVVRRYAHFVAYHARLKKLDSLSDSPDALHPPHSHLPIQIPTNSPTQTPTAAFVVDTDLATFVGYQNSSTLNGNFYNFPTGSDVIYYYQYAECATYNQTKLQTANGTITGSSGTGQLPGVTVSGLTVRAGVLDRSGQGSGPPQLIEWMHVHI